MNKVNITIRIDEDIKNKLQESALKDNKSLNNYVVTLLTKYVDSIKEGVNND